MRALILLAALLAALVLPPAVDAAPRGSGIPHTVCFTRTYVVDSRFVSRPLTVRWCRTFVAPETFVWYRP